MLKGTARAPLSLLATLCLPQWMEATVLKMISEDSGDWVRQSAVLRSGLFQCMVGRGVAKRFCLSLCWWWWGVGVLGLAKASMSCQAWVGCTGCMLCFGQSAFFRFNHPEEALRMKSMMGGSQGPSGTRNGEFRICPRPQEGRGPSKQHRGQSREEDLRAGSGAWHTESSWTSTVAALLSRAWRCQVVDTTQPVIEVGMLNSGVSL
ncbi:hypothetical protein JZ751_022700 [Albula glossodonta]|uniref:Uncharacterized protein n=1 Tax=Albula glossodonta TaxID=121402 RepID=A0A8T2PH14_9TELE|nr:hypothetical protein JZ751_022700 [Albula glossodonta]